MASELVKRNAVAAVAIPLALLLVWYGGTPLAVVVGVAGALGVRELFDLAERREIKPARTFGLVAGGLFAPLTYATIMSPAVESAVVTWWPYAIALWVMALLTWALVARPATLGRPLSAVAVSLFAPLYAGALPAFLVALRHDGHGLRSWSATWLVFFPLVVTWVCDTAAMFGGRRFGGPKLAPQVSPGKTRSGSIAGVVGALLVAPVFALLIFPRVGVSASLGDLLLIAAVLSVVGQVGDLAESLLKREAGVKDSSALIPGHGGVLDRFDSLYFVLPVAALLYRALGIR